MFGSRSYVTFRSQIVLIEGNRLLSISSCSITGKSRAPGLAEAGTVRTAAVETGGYPPHMASYLWLELDNGNLVNGRHVYVGNGEMEIELMCLLENVRRQR